MISKKEIIFLLETGQDNFKNAEVETSKNEKKKERLKIFLKLLVIATSFKRCREMLNEFNVKLLTWGK